MKRRTFLGAGLAIGLSATLGEWKAFAQNHPTAPPDPHAGMVGMSHDVNRINPPPPSLMPLEAMASGAELRPLPTLENISGQTGVFRASLEAKPAPMQLAGGKTTEIWCYNGLLPGPMISVNEGDTVEIRFHNGLPQATTIHWHGLPVPPDQDGNPHDPVPPGHDRLYRFTLPADCAGTYWYHPHPHNDVAEQVFRGLAGAFIVKSKQDPLAHLPERHLLISDLRLDKEGKIPDNDLFDWMNGREGNFVLINGQREPTITLNGTERLRLWNACSSRYCRLTIPHCELIVVGTDGGLVETPQPPVSELLLAPAERIEIVVRAQKSGVFPLQSLFYDRKKMGVQDSPETLTLAQVVVRSPSTPSLPPRLRAIHDPGAPQSAKKVVFSEDMTVMDAAMNPVRGQEGMAPRAMLKDMFQINGKTFDMNRVDLQSRVGAVEEWLIVNTSHMDHPFHLHGTQFLVLEHTLNGLSQPAPFPAWKDTINLRPGEQIKIKTVQRHPGFRMFHCHILEHESLGMMGILNVTP